MNKVILMGNLTRDIEVRYLNNNQAVATFGIAMNRRYKTASGEQKEDVTFVDCDAWGKTAEMIGQYFAKGRRILIEGRLKLETWQDKSDGSNRSKLKVVVESFHFVDSKIDSKSDGEKEEQPRQQRVQQQPSEGYSQIAEDDIPFD